jgi:hypothetical protein
MPTAYESSIIFKLDNIIDQNSEIINLISIDSENINKLIARLFVGYLLTKYSFKTFYKVFNYFFFYSDPHKPYS